MNVFMPPPYEDELLYSQCVRYLSEFSLVSHDKLLKEMFGAKLELSPHLPRNLHDFAKRTGRAIAQTKEDMFWWHSMYPFVCAYLPEERRKEAMEYAYHGRELKKMPPILAAIVPPKYLRWCPDCAAEDRARADCGEAYWHRAHQIPGVWQCDKHGVDLVDSEIPHFASGASGCPADVVIPDNLQKYRKKRECTPRETLLRQRLVALLNAGDFPRRPEHRDFREAAVRAGFGVSPRKIDYPSLYESFSEYWGDVLDRVDVLHRTRVMGMGWLHAQFNTKDVICHPVVRGLIDIFFQDRFGIDVNEMPAVERSYQHLVPVCYCPNPYADHGPGAEVKRVTSHKDKKGLLGISCECGFVAVVSEESAGKALTMADVIEVSKYGPSWAMQGAKLRAEGKGPTEIADELGVSLSCAFNWWREEGRYRPASEKELEADRTAWLALLDEIAPGLPRIAMARNNTLYHRILNRDRAWLDETINAYRLKYNLKARSRINWPARDEEYAEAIVAAASRLLKMDGAARPTVGAILKEAGIHGAAFLNSPHHLPNTVAILARVAQKPWASFFDVYRG